MCFQRCSRCPSVRYGNAASPVEEASSNSDRTGQSRRKKERSLVWPGRRVASGREGGRLVGSVLRSEGWRVSTE